jgi:lipoprotein-releasing system permease protein
MNLPFRIAVRYIFTIRSFHFITFITIISIIGIVIGVAALIIVMSIFNGFGEFTEKQLIGLDPHIRIVPSNGAWLENYPSYEKKLANYKDIGGYSPVVQGRVIAVKSDNMKVVQISGYNSKQFPNVSGIGNSSVSGKFFIGEHEGKKYIALGSNLAYSLKAVPGDNIYLMSLNSVEYSIKSMSRQQGVEFTVSSIFQTNNPEYDNTLGLTSIELASVLLSTPLNTASGIDIRLKRVDDSEKNKYLLKNDFKNCEILTWYDLHKELYNILQFERISVFIVLSLIIVIAVFNVLASLAMTVFEKKSDIAVMKSLGSTDKSILKTYLYLGMLIGSTSTFLGTVIGLALCYGQIHFNWFELNSAQYLITSLPVEVRTFDVLLVIVVSLGLSFLAALYPAKRASKQNIIDSIRNE